MSDERLRELERRWRESGRSDHEAEFLAERVRRATLGHGDLRRAALLGYPAAKVGAESDGESVLRDTPWHVEVRAALARRILYGSGDPLPSPGHVDLNGVEPGPRVLDARWARELYEALADRQGPVFDPILAPWLVANGGPDRLPAWLRRLDAVEHGGTHHETLWTLYALSRVNELLLLGFQATAEQRWEGATVTLAEYLTVFERLGFSRDVHETFHPFHHEVVEVEQAADPDEPIALVDVVWPGLSLGELRFSRAGVRVRGGRKWIVKEVAEASPLYFAFRRLRRSTRDLSHGWGSNSQWRTRFRRDYAEPEGYHYNVDGKWLIGEEPAEERDLVGSSESVRSELLTHRCALRVPEPEPGESWPYDDRWVEPR